MKKQIRFYTRSLQLMAVALLSGQLASQAQTLVGHIVDAAPGNSFSYSGQATPHYGIQWTGNDSWSPNTPTAWFSSYAGIKFFTAGARRFSISGSGEMEASIPLIMNPGAAGSNYIQFRNNGTNLAILGSSGSIYGTNPESFGLYTYGGGNLEFSTGGTKRLVINNDGRIGMGINTPTEKLDVDGNVKLNGMINWGWTGRSIKVVSPDGGISQLLQFTNSMSADEGNPQGGFDFAWHTGVSVMRIIDGNVGIGTTTPGEKLAVNGRILAKEIKVVSTSSWPDYVFQPSYKLTPLPELEKFIKTNQHLPEVPSAKEVTANGIEVGANQALLLKKIEELTLYIIDQNKEIKRLSSEVDLLKRANAYSK